YKDVYFFPTFNVADTLVVIGTILLAIYILKEE
ncbi:signal peptidase II, partial [Clostridium sporogenes]